MSEQLSVNVRAFYNPCTLGVDFLFFREIGDRREVVLPMTAFVESSSNRAQVTEPSLRVADYTAQSMLQALWDAGLRPNDGAGSGAEAKALRDHIVFAEGVTGKLLAKVTK